MKWYFRLKITISFKFLNLATHLVSGFLGSPCTRLDSIETSFNYLFPIGAFNRIILEKCEKF